MGKQKATKKANRKSKRARVAQLIDEVGSELNDRQKLFCTLYTTDKFCFGNASAAYAEAYGLTEAQRKKTARQLGYQLLTNIYVRDFINKFLKESFTDVAVDNELARVIQQNKSLQPKVQAIAEYNKMKGRSGEASVTQNIFFLNEAQRKRIARRALAGNKPSEGASG